MKDYYDIEIAGVSRRLPVCKINNDVSIAAFIMFGDVEITEKCACALLAKCPEFDVIMTAEAKGIPLAYEAARQSGKPYVVARKGKKLYMRDPITVDVRSITTGYAQRLYIGSDEAQLICGRRVLIMDDVISTGNSLSAVLELTEKAGGIISACAAVLAEGDAKKRDDIIFLTELPLIMNNNQEK